MDDKAPLIITLSALRKTFQVHESEQSYVSSETARQLNYVFNAINKIVPGAYLPTTYTSGAKPSEVLAQIELAFDQLGQGSMSATKSGQDEPLPVRSASQPAQQAKPKIFIGCSTQGLTEAEIIQTLLVQSDKVYPVIWNQGVFGLMFGTLETLVAKVPEYDYAVLVLTPDDVVVKKEHEENAARDNVLFELGLFMGALGRERTFVVAEDSVNLPSDLAGITVARFKRGGGADILSNMGPVVFKLKLEMKVIP